MEELSNYSHKNHFDSLPDDVVLFIFDKVLEAKSLCRCSVVSKRFASIIPRVHNMSATLIQRFPPNWNVESAQHGNENENANDRYNSSLDFVLGFKELISLKLELPFFCQEDWEVSWLTKLKWKTTRITTTIENFTFLMATSLFKMELPPSHPNEHEDVTVRIRRDELVRRIEIAFGCLDDACMRLRILLNIVEEHTMLRSITVTDYIKQGKISVAGEQVAELRDLDKSNEAMTKVEARLKLSMKYGHVPSLYLRKSRFLMEDVTLVFIKLVEQEPGHVGGGDVDDHIDDEILAGSFDGDEGGLFGEAVEEILKNHKNKLSTGSISEV